MHLLESMNMAVKTLAANKMRSFLTVLGIVIGNASVVAMVGIGQGAQQFAESKVESLGSNLLYVFVNPQTIEGGVGAMPEILLSDAEAIATQASAVKLVSPSIVGNYSLSYESRNTKASVQGVTPAFAQVRNLTMARGQFFDRTAEQGNAFVVVLGAELAKKLFSDENPIGKEVVIHSIGFRVVGVTAPKGAFLGVNPDSEAFVPITTAADRLAGRRSPRGTPIDQMEISAKDKGSIRAAAFQTTNILTRLHGKKDFNIMANRSLQDFLTQLTSALSILLTAIAAISLVVGGVGIMNIMLVSVTERTKEIGLRKAIGAPERDILMQFLIEAIILATAGGIIGIGSGLTITTLIGTFTPLKPVVPFSVIVVATTISGGIGLVFGVVPARQAAKLDPIVALRST